MTEKPLEGEVIQNKSGRPAKVYDRKTMYPTLEALAKGGGTDAMMMAALKVCRATFYKWKRDDEDFKEDYFNLEPLCQAVWETKGMENIANKNFNATLYMGFMNNKFGWTRGAGGDSEKKGDTNINISGNLNIANIGNLSTEELETQLLDQLSNNSGLLEQIKKKDEENT